MIVVEVFEEYFRYFPLGYCEGMVKGNQHRSKSQALSSTKRDQIFGGADLFLSIVVNYQL